MVRAGGAALFREVGEQGFGVVAPPLATRVLRLVDVEDAEVEPAVAGQHERDFLADAGASGCWSVPSDASAGAGQSASSLAQEAFVKMRESRFMGVKHAYRPR